MIFRTDSESPAQPKDHLPDTPADGLAMRSIRVNAIDALLPQTQCTRCGYPSCRDYASALEQATTLPNRCPPGGQAGADRLAAMLGQPSLLLDPDCGSAGPRLVALIDPAQCIGCTKCIIACPVDAIIGGPRRMHTVLPSLCSGCDLCVPPCPVDCISIEPLNQSVPWTDAHADAARLRFQARAHRREDDQWRHRERLESEARRKLASLDEQISQPAGEMGNASDTETADLQRKRRVVAAAIERARQRQASRS